MHSRHVLAALLVVLLGACATTATDQEVRRANMHRRLAEAKLQKNSLELAIREYRAALELNSSDPETHFGLAEAYRRKGMLDESEASLLESLRLEPDHPDARLNLSVVYLQQERWNDAIDQTTLLIADPTFQRPSRALVNRAWARYKLGDRAGARSDLDEALSSDSRNYTAHLNLGVLLLDEGEVLDAMVQFGHVLRLLERRPPSQFGATEAQARFYMAQAHVKLGQRGKAVEQLRLAAERGGRGEWALKSKEYLAVLQ